MPSTADLTRALVHWLAHGKLDARVVLPALQDPATESAAMPSLVELLEAVASESAPAVATLRDHLRATCQREVLAARERVVAGFGLPPEAALTLAGLPLHAQPGWRDGTTGRSALLSALATGRDLLLVQAHGEPAPITSRAVRDHFQADISLALRALRRHGGVLDQSLLAAAQAGGGTAWPENVAAVLALALQQEQQAAAQRAAQAIGEANVPLPEDVDEAQALTQWTERWRQTDDPVEQHRLLDVLCSWPSPRAGAALREVVAPGWMQERAQLIWTLRFGLTWDPARPQQWRRWLEQVEGEWHLQATALRESVQQDALAVLWLWYQTLPTPDATTLAWLQNRVVEQLGKDCWESFASRWERRIPAEERACFGLGGPPDAPAVPALAPPIARPAGTGAELDRTPASPPRLPTPPPIPAIRPGPALRVGGEPVSAQPLAAQTSPPAPSVWEKHIQPVFAANWYVLAGIGMVIVGSSLVAFYTWDKHWLVRYTIMPVLLAFFTWALARAGQWIEERDPQFKAMAATLRGAAIGLLPINFMAIALLSGDPEVSRRGLAVALMALIYLAFFGWGLRRWCAAVHPGLGNRLGGALLALNALVALGPLARTLGGWDGERLWQLMGVGFHAGLGIVAVVVVWFSRRILTLELAEERRVPWFVGATLGLTYLQVFAWVHGFMQHLPQVHVYAPAVILVGWLALFAEGVSLRLRRTPQEHGGESFLGFALVLLGLLMGAAHPTIRIVAFALAGAVWLGQALRREHPLHYWTALTLFVLGGASVTLRDAFPASWRAPAGLVMAVGLILAPRLGLGRRHPEFDKACQGMQAAVLTLTTLVAVLTQWHEASPPWVTGVWLLVIAALLVWRALRHDQMAWLHTAMVVLALALPYLGFVQMEKRTLRHNTMAFGLGLVSWLWLAANWITRQPLVRQVRSTVLLFYGVLAVTAMLLRVGLGDAAPDPLWFRDYLEYLGPFLMTGALVWGTYYSRSHLVAALAVAINVILFPELRANLRETLPGLAWGSGCGSAISALALVLLGFGLRPWQRLKNLGEGDLLLGREPFPLRCHDHALFTTPLVLAALYLILRVETWDLARNWTERGVRIETALALVLSGLGWLCVAAFWRTGRRARAAVHLGWLWGAIGMGLGYWRLAAEPHWSWPLLLAGLWLQGLFWLSRYGLERRWDWAAELLTGQLRRVLADGSLLVLGLSAGGLVWGVDWPRLQWLALFVAVQAVWHGLTKRAPAFGVALFFLLWISILAVTAPGPGPLWLRMSVEHSLMPTLGVLLALQIIWWRLETADPLYQRLAPLVLPMALLSSALVGLLGAGALLHAVMFGSVSVGCQWLLLGLLLVTARAHRSGYLLLMGLLLASILAQGAELRALASVEQRVLLLTVPWRLASLALALVVVLQAGRWLHQRIPVLFAGARPQPVFGAPVAMWVQGPAVALACASAAYHTVDPAYRASAVQLWTPYLGGAACAAIARWWCQAWGYGFAGPLVVLGNLHLVRVAAGHWLLAHGLSELHLVGLGLCLSLAQGSLVRCILRRESAIAALNQASLALAGLVLGLLSAHYVGAPNLESMTPLRLVFSGVMALLAGWYFRRAARHPGPGEGAYADYTEGLYHYGLVLALWCAALLVPWLRQPALALVALSGPLFFFWARAEAGARGGRPEARRYRHSAAVLGFMILALYVFRSVLHMVMFPETPIATRHYHQNAALLMLVSWVLLRLHGLGGTGWLAFYGGLGLMGGSYFLLTALPGLSPFDRPLPAAWMAILLAQFWILVSYEQSPLRTGIQQWARLDDRAWHRLRRSWGIALLAAVHGAGLWGLFDPAAKSQMLAPLVAGVASVILHQGILRQSPVYLAIGGLELGLALHMDFLVPSWIGRQQVIWVLLALLLALRVGGLLKPTWASAVRPAGAAAFLSTLILAHVLFHRPWSATGLWAVAFLALLAGSHSLRGCPSSDLGLRASAWLLGCVPAWLVYFSQAPLADLGLGGAVLSWPVLVTALAIFLTGLAAERYQAKGAARYHTGCRSRFFLLDQTLAEFERHGASVHVVTMGLALAMVAAVQVGRYSQPFAAQEWVVLVALHVAMAAAWYRRAQTSPSLAASFLMQLCVAGALVAGRRQLMLTTNWWSYEYDVWASLAASTLLTGARGVQERQPRPLATSLLVSLCGLPILAMVWVLVHGLGANLALLVVGLHSLMFAYLGREDRESPFTLVALGGFVVFILLTFWTKLHFRALHAYVIPVGLGVLVLVHLVRDRVPPATRSAVRLVTSLAMLGSSGYYALADSRYPVTFNLTLIVLGLVAMGLGSLLRVRIYLALGFTGLVMALGNLLTKALVHADRSVRMTVVGSLVLVIGAALIFGAIYYKTNKDRIDAWVDRWRARFGGWE